MKFELGQTRKRRTLLHRAVLWGMVAFYVLASGRALVPGLCATIAAAERSGAETQAMHSARSCCQVPHDESSKDKSSTAPEGEGSGCAFCHLVQSFGHIPVYVHAPEPWTTHVVQLALSPSVHPATGVLGAADGRAPPA